MKAISKINRRSTRVWETFYLVPSESRPDEHYTVAKRVGKNEYGCSCPRWIYSHPHKPCKHIQRVLNEIVNAQAVNVQPKTVEVADLPAKVQSTLSRFSMIEIE